MFKNQPHPKVNIFDLVSLGFILAGVVLLVMSLFTTFLIVRLLIAPIDSDQITLLIDEANIKKAASLINEQTAGE